MVIYSIYGYGKGKTESAIGITVRAVANKEKVLFAQFLKDGSSTENKLLTTICDVINSNTNGIVLPSNKNKSNLDEVNKLYYLILDMIGTNKYNLLVLDEVLVAIDIGLMSFSMLDIIIKECRIKDIDIYMTGRVRNRINRLKIKELSDCVTDAKSVSHYYDSYCVNCDNSFPSSYTYCPDCNNKLVSLKICKKGRDY